MDELGAAVNKTAQHVVLFACVHACLRGGEGRGERVDGGEGQRQHTSLSLSVAVVLSVGVSVHLPVLRALSFSLHLSESVCLFFWPSVLSNIITHTTHTHTRTHTLSLSLSQASVKLSVTYHADPHPPLPAGREEDKGREEGGGSLRIRRCA